MTRASGRKVTVAYSLTQAGKRIFSMCPQCQQVLAEGVWALDGKMFDHHFLIGPSPRPKCCGEERHVPFLFETLGAAQEKMEEVCINIAEHKSHLVYNYYGRESFIPKYLN